MSLREKGRTAIKWNLVEKFLKRGITFIISIFLARILEPEDFGLVAMIGVFVSIADSFKDFGMGQAIVQQKKITQIQLSTIFYINVLVGIIFVFVFWFSAPFVGEFYDNFKVVPIMRISSLGILVSALGIVNNALAQRSLDYKVFTKTMVVHSLVYGLITIVLALYDFEAWSIVIGGLFASIASLIYLVTLVKWIPDFQFSFSSIKSFLRKSLGFFNIGLINNVVDRLDGLFIGKYFSAADLGFFNRAKSLQEMPLYTLILPVSRPFFPIFSKIQDERKKLETAFYELFSFLQFLAVLIFGVLLLSAKGWIILLYSDKWIESVPYFYWLLFLLPLLTLNFISTSFLKGIGHLKLLSIITIVNRLGVLLPLFIGMNYGILIYIKLLIATRFIVLLGWVVILKYRYAFNVWWLLKDFILYSLLALILVWSIGFISFDHYFVDLIIKSSLYLFLFISSAILLKTKGALTTWQEVLKIKKSFIK